MSIKFKSNEEGRCPICNSQMIEYFGMEFDIMGNVYYPWHCPDCNADGKEWYFVNYNDTGDYNGNVGTDEGKCPSCGAEIEYGTAEPDGNSLGYEYSCSECGGSGVEWYDLDFDSHTIDGHENEDIIMENKTIAGRELKIESVSYDDLVRAGEDLWRDGAVIRPTKVDGIYDCSTDGHGGYLVDTTKFPELAKYGEKTYIDNIVGFEEDYEALKVIWLHPEVLADVQLDSDFIKNLTIDQVTKYDNTDEFKNEFPERKAWKEPKEIKSEDYEFANVEYDDTENALLKEIFRNLQNGRIYGRDVTNVTYPYFDRVLYLIWDDAGHTKKAIGWSIYGSSANKNTIEDLKWVLDNIFEMKPSEFIATYKTDLDTKLYENKQLKTEAEMDINVMYDEYKEAYHQDLDIKRVPCVIARDTMMSGWGDAEGKNHYQVVLCADSVEAYNIAHTMQSRAKSEGLANIRTSFGIQLPRNASVSYNVGRNASAWNMGDSWYESRYGKVEEGRYKLDVIKYNMLHDKFKNDKRSYDELSDDEKQELDTYRDLTKKMYNSTRNHRDIKSEAIDYKNDKYIATTAEDGYADRKFYGKNMTKRNKLRSYDQAHRNLVRAYQDSRVSDGQAVDQISFDNLPNDDLEAYKYNKHQAKSAERVNDTIWADEHNKTAKEFADKIRAKHKKQEDIDDETEEENDIDLENRISLLDIALSELPKIGVEEWGTDDELLFTADTKIIFENLKRYEHEIPKYYYDNAGYNDWSNGIDDYLQDIIGIDPEDGESDNTYNWSAPLTHNVEFTLYEVSDANRNLCLFKGSIHIAGDVRGNYTTEFLLEFDSKDDCFETIFDVCSENCGREVELDGKTYVVSPHFFNETVDIWCNETQESYDDVYCSCKDELKELIANNKKDESKSVSKTEARNPENDEVNAMIRSALNGSTKYVKNLEDLGFVLDKYGPDGKVNSMHYKDGDRYLYRGKLRRYDKDADLYNYLTKQRPTSWEEQLKNGGTEAQKYMSSEKDIAENGYKQYALGPADLGKAIPKRFKTGQSSINITEPYGSEKIKKYKEVNRNIASKKDDVAYTQNNINELQNDVATKQNELANTQNEIDQLEKEKQDLVANKKTEDTSRDLYNKIKDEPRTANFKKGEKLRDEIVKAWKDKDLETAWEKWCQLHDLFGTGYDDEGNMTDEWSEEQSLRDMIELTSITDTIESQCIYDVTDYGKAKTYKEMGY